MIDNLLWEKYRPKTLEDIILLPRIRKHVENGVSDNLILFGHYGTGKSSLAKILTKGKPTLYKNTSLATSIDVLRTEITKHVDTLSMFHPNDKFKYVYLDEFEEASSAYQNGLKAFIEDYSNNTRFILVTNHIHKIEDGIISRSVKLDFNPSNENEIKWWKIESYKKLKTITEKEDIEIDDKNLKRIVTQNFPDIRSMIKILGLVKQTGVIDYAITSFDNTLKSAIYKTVTTGTIVDIQDFIMSNFGPEKIQDLFNICGRPLLEVVITTDPNILKSEKLGDIYTTIAEHSMWLNTIKGGDPVVVGVSALNKIKNILNG